MAINFKVPKNTDLSWDCVNEFTSNGYTTVLCPKCHTKPIFTASYSPMTKRLERIIGGCECGYIRHCSVSITFEPLSDDEKGFAMGYRKVSKEPLTDAQIEIVKTAARSIGIPENILVFNDPKALISKSGTSYHFEDDKIYITQNVFPDDTHASTHPRDLLSVAAVLAHEYYGHRPNREEYLYDAENGIETTPYWKDEVRASINAAKYAPGLSRMDKVMLIQDAEYRARENFQTLEMDDYMRNILWGDGSAKPIAAPLIFKSSIEVDAEAEALYKETFKSDEVNHIPNVFHNDYRAEFYEGEEIVIFDSDDMEIESITDPDIVDSINSEEDLLNYLKTYYDRHIDTGLSL